MILPGSLPLADGDVRNELTYLLPPGWDPVIEGDIDGDRAETTDLEAKEPRFGQVNAARRVARTLFLGTAPSSVATKSGIRGLDRGRVLLGCVQPGQTSAVYADALGRLADRLHYLNSTGDKSADTTRYWFDTRANLRREMEDRKRRFGDATDVRKKIEEVVKKLFATAPLFDGVHVFTPHADVPDDSALRLVVLPPEQSYAKDAPRPGDGRGPGVPAVARRPASAPGQPADVRGGRSGGSGPPAGRHPSGDGLGEHRRGRGRGTAEHRPEPEAAGREGVAGRRRRPAAGGPRVLPVAPLPRPGRPEGGPARRGSLRPEHDQRDGRAASWNASAGRTSWSSRRGRRSTSGRS